MKKEQERSQWYPIITQLNAYCRRDLMRTGKLLGLDRLRMENRILGSLKMFIKWGDLFVLIEKPNISKIEINQVVYRWNYRLHFLFYEFTQLTNAPRVFKNLIKRTYPRDIISKSIWPTFRPHWHLHEININYQTITGSSPQQKAHNFHDSAPAEWWITQISATRIIKICNELAQRLGLILEQAKGIGQNRKAKGKRHPKRRGPADCVRWWGVGQSAERDESQSDVESGAHL